MVISYAEAQALPSHARDGLADIHCRSRVECASSITRCKLPMDLRFLDVQSEWKGY